MACMAVPFTGTPTTTRTPHTGMRLTARAPRPALARQPTRRSVLAAAAANDAPHPLRVMISGPPAAGKGTQCANIIKEYGLVHISAGDLLRAQVAAGTPEGKKAAGFMSEGKLVPNEVVVNMVVGALNGEEAQSHGWLLDGYPRSAEQATAIDKAGIHPDIFLLLNVPDDDIVQRVAGRRMDPVTGEIYHLTFRPPPKEIASRLVQRADDTEEAIRTRLATYHANLQAVLSFYAGEIVEIDGSRSMDEVYDDIRVALVELLMKLEGPRAASA